MKRQAMKTMKVQGTLLKARASFVKSKTSAKARDIATNSKNSFMKARDIVMKSKTPAKARPAMKSKTSAKARPTLQKPKTSAQARDIVMKSKTSAKARGTLQKPKTSAKARGIVANGAGVGSGGVDKSAKVAGSFLRAGWLSWLV